MPNTARKTCIFRTLLAASAHGWTFQAQPGDVGKGCAMNPRSVRKRLFKRRKRDNVSRAADAIDAMRAKAALEDVANGRMEGEELDAALRRLLIGESSASS